jgi:hypothetical protein
VHVELGPGWVLTKEAMINITFVVLIELRLASPKQWKIIQSVVQRHKAIAASRKNPLIRNCSRQRLPVLCHTQSAINMVYDTWVWRGPTLISMKA